MGSSEAKLGRTCKDRGRTPQTLTQISKENEMIKQGNDEPICAVATRSIGAKFPNKTRNIEASSMTSADKIAHGSSQTLTVSEEVNIAVLEEIIIAEQAQIDCWRHSLIIMKQGLCNRIRRRDVLIE
jgi:hypothetical protein